MCLLRSIHTTTTRINNNNNMPLLLLSQTLLTNRPKDGQDPSECSLFHRNQRPTAAALQNIGTGIYCIQMEIYCDEHMNPAVRNKDKLIGGCAFNVEAFYEPAPLDTGVGRPASQLLRTIKQQIQNNQSTGVPGRIQYATTSLSKRSPRWHYRAFYDPILTPAAEWNSIYCAPVDGTSD